MVEWADYLPISKLSEWVCVSGEPVNGIVIPINCDPLAVIYSSSLVLSSSYIISLVLTTVGLGVMAVFWFKPSRGKKITGEDAQEESCLPSNRLIACLLWHWFC